MPSTFTDYMFARISETPFEVDEWGYVYVLDTFTNWNVCPLPLCVLIWSSTSGRNLFITRERLITSVGALVFLEDRCMSPAELSGILNLILFTIHPE